MTLQQHLLKNVTAIRKEAEERSARYNLPIGEATEQVIEGWTEAYYEEMRDRAWREHDEPGQAQADEP